LPGEQAGEEEAPGPDASSGSDIRVNILTVIPSYSSSTVQYSTAVPGTVVLYSTNNNINDRS
jgi:hypothetical protein